MKLPEKFKFAHAYTEEIFSAELVGETYVVSWDHESSTGSAGYSVEEVAGIVESGSWVILPESFPQLITLSEGLQVLINEKKDATDLAYDELKSLLLTRALITRLLDGK